MSNNTAEVVIVWLSKQNILERNYGPILEILSPEKIASPTRLRELHNSVSCVVDGYNDIPDPLYTIPEVRAYFQGLLTVWPYWFYFCSVDTSNLLIMLFSIVENLRVAHRNGHHLTKIGVEVDPQEFRRIILRLFVPMNELYERAGFDEARNVARTNAIMDYIVHNRTVI